MTTLVPTDDHVRPTRLSKKPIILVADDEPLIRDLLLRYLSAHDFHPLLARNGQEALDIYRAKGEEIALVLLDIRMPGLSGPETLTAIQAINPRVRCCFMSGDFGVYSPEELQARGALHLFTKPFLPRELVSVLRRLAVEEEQEALG